MKKYYIVDENNCFWCENNFGYWSSFKESLKYRFEGILIWILPLYLSMKLCKVKCRLAEIK
jgi:hypothetical protein